MLDLLVKGLGRLPALRTERRPNVAAFIGFFFGGLGLGLYFRSFVDFLLPIAVTVVLIVTSSSIGGGLASFGWLAGALVAGLYGYYRAVQSNQQRISVNGASAPITPLASRDT